MDPARLFLSLALMCFCGAAAPFAWKDVDQAIHVQGHSGAEADYWRYWRPLSAPPCCIYQDPEVVWLGGLSGGD